ATGTVKAKAMFENRDDVLFPNQFVNVRVRVDTVSGAVVVPVTAIQRSASGTFVYVVGDDRTVAMRSVKTGTLAGELQQVTEGVQPGERVVTDGVDRLREGDKVKIDDVPAAGTRAGKPDGASPGRRDAAPAR
ncbi:MAG: efflux transporter periplasmic adaptor subunit, partial [Methyloversatilis sp. 12-65-5]